MSTVKSVSKPSFAFEVEQSAIPVLVDFYADWCGPCRMLAPALQRLAGEFAGRVKIVKVNADDEPELADRYQVSALPTLAFFSGGRLVGQTTGVPSEAALRKALNQLSGDPSSANRRVG